jgi:hypothetical protein
LLPVPNPLASLCARLADLGDAGRRKSPLLRRTPKLSTLIEWAARFGYGARGFVYLSVGVLIVLAATDRVGEAVGTKGAIGWLSQQPFGRVWLFMVGIGLAAFFMWRTLQAVFDADHEGTSLHGWRTRASQAFSGFGYGFLAFNAFALLKHTPADPAATDVAKSHEQAATVLAMPFGNWILAGAGLALFGIGVANIVRAWREDFTEYLACSEHLCRRVEPLARAGYIARGLAYLPLAVLVTLAGLRSKASDVTSFSSALDAVEGQPAGPWILALAGLGFIAFGAFSFVEARFRRIRPPRDLNPLT